MKLSFLSLASGSSGNCYYLGTSEFGMLIDAGIGIRTIKKVLKDRSIDFTKIVAVLITHDHADHIKTVGYLGEKLEEADAVFMNTCSIRDNAEQKILNRLEFFYSLKKKKRNLIVGVLGCMAERVKDDLITNHHVDLVVGPDAYLTLPDLVAAVEAGEKAINVELSTTETYRDVIPSRICGNHISGFVSIMRGCNNFCTYCIVPYTRGRERSRDVESILNEV